MIDEVCKSCGGTLYREGNYYVCKFCGNRWMIDADSDVHVIDRANAWMALRNCDFEKAAEAFEYILEKEPGDHEAYWGRALSNAGIIYVTDLDENKKVPTCNNISESSFLDSYDVKKAIEAAPKDISASYKAQAQRIEAIRVEWLKKASKEPDYDVFICFKDSDRENNIERTKDSYDAQDLYYALTNAGYKVFFSRISLKDKVSEHYEPYIYNALKTAKVMIVFGEKPEYFNAVWVKNEWTRFRTRIENGEKDKNSLVVVYKGMNPSALPVGLRSRQCLNAGEITFLEDLKKHIEKVVRAAKKKEETPPASAKAVEKSEPKTGAQTQAAPEKKKKSKKGFVLVLLLITAAVIALIAMPSMLSGQSQSTPNYDETFATIGGIYYDPSGSVIFNPGNVDIGYKEYPFYNTQYDIELLFDEDAGIVPDGAYLEVLQLYGEYEGYQLAYEALCNMTSDIYVYDLSLYYEDQRIEPDSTIEVGINMQGISEKEVAVYYVDEEGNATELDHFLKDDGRVYFATDHMGCYVLASKWQRYVQLRLETNGGECSKYYVDISYLYQDYELPIPQKAGYRFLGWYTDSYDGWGGEYTLVENSGRWEIEGNGERTLVAMWEADCNHDSWDNGRLTSTNERTYTCYGCGKTRVEQIVGGYLGSEIGYEYDAETETIYVFGEGNMYEYSRPEEFSKYEKTVKNVVITEGVVGMGMSVFADFTMLTSVTLPSTLQALGGFEGCKSLQTITIPAGVIFIKEGAFRNCTSLSEITISGSIETITTEAFYGCTSLTKVTLSEGVKYIYERAFEGCAELEIIYLPDSLREGSISYNAFAGCYDLTEVHFAGSELDWKLLSIDNSNSCLTNAGKFIYGKENDPTRYYITLDANGGFCYEEQIVVKRGDWYELPTPTKDGYSFIGWYDGTGYVSGKDMWNGTKDLKLEAKWSIETYTIDYDYYDGYTVNPNSYTINDVISISNPTQAGCIFLGWTVLGEVGAEPRTDFVIKGRTGNLYLISHWQGI